MLHRYAQKRQGLIRWNNPVNLLAFIGDQHVTLHLVVQKRREGLSVNFVALIPPLLLLDVHAIQRDATLLQVFFQWTARMTGTFQQYAALFRWCMFCHDRKEFLKSSSGLIEGEGRAGFKALVASQ